MKDLADTCMALLNEGVFEDVELALVAEGKILIEIGDIELDDLRDAIEAPQFGEGPHLNNSELIAEKIYLRTNEYPKVELYGVREENNKKYYCFMISKKE